MKRRAFIGGAACGLLPGFLLGYTLNRKVAAPSKPGAPYPPNIVVLIADDMRWDALGAAGNRIIHTPNLDALAADGALFENHFVTTSICPTSRASIFIGQYARRHQIWDFSTALNAAQVAMSYFRRLRRAGFRTGFVGKWGIGGPLPEPEFDDWQGFAGQGYYLDPSGQRKTHLTTHLGSQALAFLENNASKQPFCLTVSFKAPHAQDGDPQPFQPAPEFFKLYNDVTIPVPATATAGHFARLPAFLQSSEGRARWQQRFSTPEKYQRSVKQYYQLVTGLDQAVGRIIRFLQDADIYHRSCIVFTSDNGFFLGEHGLAGKWWGYEESIRTPLIIKPSFQPGVRRISAMTLNIDIAPTLLQLAGLPVPKTMQGSSLIPLFKNQAAPLRTAWLYEHLFEFPTIARSEGVRTRRYKYLRYIDQSQENESLFDLYHDPYEEKNVIAEASYKQVLNRQIALLNHFKRTLA